MIHKESLLIRTSAIMCSFEHLLGYVIIVGILIPVRQIHERLELYYKECNMSPLALFFFCMVIPSSHVNHHKHALNGY